MWDFVSEQLSDLVVQFRLEQEGNAVTFSQTVSLWESDAGFRNEFSTVLQKSSFLAYRWETPPLTKQNFERAFEFVLLNCEGLERPIDERAFDEHFDKHKSVVAFSNLSGDASLVVPCPVSEQAKYGHLASFVRSAPNPQLHEFWSTIGIAMRSRVNEKPVWLNTAGMGVSWLHVRLDSRPKYYGHQPYREMLGTEA